MCVNDSLHISTSAERSILNVFDFDNTLFRSPMPNPKLWDSTLLGPLTAFQQINNGWWHDIRSLHLGEEIEKLGWKDWWIEPIVNKVRQSMSDPRNLTVLLTGRVKNLFEEKIIAMVTAKGLHFDLVILKPSIDYEHVRLTGEESHSTTSFKKSVIENILVQNPSVKEVYIWEDRPAHVLKFRTLIAELIARGRIESGSVTQVIEPPSHMPEAIEKRNVSEMVKEHNDYVDKWLKVTSNKRLPSGAQIPKKIALWSYVKYTGVFLPQDYTRFLLDQFPPPFKDEVDTSGWTISADHVTMCLQKCSDSMLNECGGLGAMVFVRVLAVGQYQNRIWALKVGEASPSDLPAKCPAHIPIDIQGNIGRLISNNPTPHITMAYDQMQGTKAYESNLITEWNELPPNRQYILQGVVRENHITGIKKLPPPPPQQKAAVSLGTLIKRHRPQLKGPEIGKLVKFIQTRMVESGIINSVDNMEEITSLIVTAPRIEEI